MTVFNPLFFHSMSPLRITNYALSTSLKSFIQSTNSSTLALYGRSCAISLAVKSSLTIFIKKQFMNNYQNLHQLNAIKPGTKILFANFPADGHFNPLTGLAAHLKKIGCDVRWYTSDRYQAKIERLGI